MLLALGLALPSVAAAQATPVLTIAVVGDGFFTEGEGNTIDFTVFATPAPSGALMAEVVLTRADNFVLQAERTQTVAFVAGDAMQTVSFPIANDDIDDIGSGNGARDINATLQAGDGYTLGSPSIVFATVIEDDHAGVSITTAPATEPPALTVGESGSGTYTAVLDTEPSGMVTMTVRSDTPDVAQVSTATTTTPGTTATLTFTIADWDTPQTITVSGVDDLFDHDRGATITHRTSGGGYGNGNVFSANIPTLAVTITNDDTFAADNDARLSALALYAGDAVVAANEVPLTPSLAATPQRQNRAFNFTARVAAGTTQVTLDWTTASTQASSEIRAGGTVHSGNTITLAGDITAIVLNIRGAGSTPLNNYQITLTRAAATDSTDATLSALTLSMSDIALTPAFASGTSDYAASVSNDVSATRVTATANDDSRHSVVVASDRDDSIGAFNTVELEVGANIITVVVVAEDGVATQTYTVTVTRAEPPVFAPPSSVTATAGEGEVTVVWTAGSDDAIGYRVCVHAGVSFDLLQCTAENVADLDDPTARSHTFTDVVGGTAYAAAVSATFTTDNTGWVSSIPPSVTPTAPLPTLTIVADATSFTEGNDDIADFTVTSDIAPSDNLMVEVTLTGADDFVAAGERTQTITIAADATSATASFAIADDETREPAATATATINADAAAYHLGDPSTATATINDDDGDASPMPTPGLPRVSIAPTQPSFTEGDDTSADFTVTASPAPTDDLEVVVTLTGTETFVVGVRTQTVTLTRNEPSKTASFVIENDNIVEPAATAIATIGDNSDYRGGGATATATINDDEPTLTIAADAATFTESMDGATADFTVTASPAPTSDLMVDVTLTSADHFVVAAERTQIITIFADATTATARFPIADDGEGDANDGVDAAAIATATIEPADGYTLGSPSSATARICDDDGGACGIGAAAQMAVAESVPVVAAAVASNAAGAISNRIGAVNAGVGGNFNVASLTTSFATQSAAAMANGADINDVVGDGVKRLLNGKTHSLALSGDGGVSNGAGVWLGGAYQNL
ncbi:MAG: cadherin-like beta sandwich domain-containing protein, partial [bacterium]